MLHRLCKTAFALAAFALLTRTARADDQPALYVANNGGNTISEFSLTGALIRTFPSNGVKPIGIAADTAGNLYVCCSGSNTVRKFGPAGQDLGAFVSTGLDNPVYLAFDAAGNLYVLADNFSGNTRTTSRAALLCGTQPCFSPGEEFH